MHQSVAYCAIVNVRSNTRELPLNMRDQGIARASSGRYDEVRRERAELGMTCALKLLKSGLSGPRRLSLYPLLQDQLHVEW